MKRNGFTLIELLVVLAICAILLCLLIGGIGGCKGGMGYNDPVTGKGYYDDSLKMTNVYRCVKTYEVAAGESSTSKRVDMFKVDENGNDVGTALTFTCDDDFWASISNSGTLYAQFESGQFYSVSTIGFRSESLRFPRFPNVVSVSKVPKPSGNVQAEVEFP